jgi:hypothetical protein
VFGTRLAVHAPPKPCPCVVQITALGGDGRSLTLPVTVVGAPNVPLPPLVKGKTKHPLTVEDAKLTGGSWTSWFGAPVHRTLVLRVRNTSGAPIEDPLLLVAAGRGSDPTEPQHVPVQGPFASGEVRTVRVPVTFSAPSFGSYTVRYRVGADGTTMTKRLGTSSWPWGLFILILLVVQGVLLLVRNRVRDRVAPDDDDPDAPADDLTAPDASPDDELVAAEPAKEPIRWRKFGETSTPTVS